MAIGNKLKQILNERGITVKDFAKKIGVPPTTLYSFINRDSQDVKMDLVMKICTALEIDISDLITVTTDVNTTSIVNKNYYLNEETAKVAQEIFENKELRMLFDAARDASPEDLKLVHDMMLALKRKEQGSNDEGC